MGQRILVPLDSSAQSKQALEYAVENFPDAEFVLFHAVHGRPGHYLQMGKSGFSPTEQYEEEQEEAETFLEEMRTEFVPSDADVSTVIESGEPARAIVAYTEDHDVDLVVLGSHGRSGASRVLLGSVAESVTRRSAVPVLIVR